MSNIDKQALRTAAENATPGEWCTDDYHGVIADAGLNANYYIASCSGPDNRHNKRFIAAANPATVLALLDELEVVNELFLRAKALMYQSGGTPIENSLNPIDAWLYDAERVAAADKGAAS